MHAQTAGAKSWSWTQSKPSLAGLARFSSSVRTRIKSNDTSSRRCQVDMAFRG